MKIDVDHDHIPASQLARWLLCKSGALVCENHIGPCECGKITGLRTAGKGFEVRANGKVFHIGVEVVFSTKDGQA